MAVILRRWEVTWNQPQPPSTQISMTHGSVGSSLSGPSSAFPPRVCRVCADGAAGRRLAPGGRRGGVASARRGTLLRWVRGVDASDDGRRPRRLGDPDLHPARASPTRRLGPRNRRPHAAAAISARSGRCHDRRSRSDSPFRPPEAHWPGPVALGCRPGSWRRRGLCGGQRGGGLGRLGPNAGPYAAGVGGRGRRRRGRLLCADRRHPALPGPARARRCADGWGSAWR